MQLVWIGMWSWFEGGWGGFKRKKWDKWQKEVEKLCISILHDHAKILHNHVKWTIRHFCYKSNISILHDHAKFCITMRNGPESEIVLQTKENCQVDFAWSCKNFAQSYKMLSKVVTIVAEFLILHNHAKLAKLVRNDCFVIKLQIAWWKSFQKTS